MQKILTKITNMVGYLLTLTKMVKSEPPQFISVAGDNYYPKKVKSLEGKKEKKPKDSTEEGSSVKSEKKKEKSK